jgi:hypothetical protein
MHSPPLESNFCEEHGKAVKPTTVQGTWGYVDKCDHMMNSSLLADGPGNGQRSYFSIFWALPFSTALFFSPLVA